MDERDGLAFEAEPEAEETDYRRIDMGVVPYHQRMRFGVDFWVSAAVVVVAILAALHR